VIAHTLDLQGERVGRSLTPHGLQVGLASILAAEAYRVFLAETDPTRIDLEACFPGQGVMRSRVTSSFANVSPSGAMGEARWGEYRSKLGIWHAQRPQIEAALANWPALRRRVQARTRRPEVSREILRAAGAPLEFEDLSPPIPESWVLFAFRHASFTRRRLTLGGLIEFFGWDREDLWARVWDGVTGRARQAKVCV
jgi:hypothetical protein